MAEHETENLPRISAARYLYRRLGKWQWRGLLTSIAAAGSGFVGVMYNKFGAESPSATQASVAHTSMMAGLAFLIAFVFFFWVRSFLKWGASIVALLVVGAAAFSYFSGINLDMSRVQDGYGSVSGWIWDQCRSAIGIAASNISGAASAGLGAWMGASKGK